MHTSTSACLQVQSCTQCKTHHQYDKALHYLNAQNPSVKLLAIAHQMLNSIKLLVIVSIMPIKNMSDICQRPWPMMKISSKGEKNDSAALFFLFKALVTTLIWTSPVLNKVGYEMC